MGFFLGLGPICCLLWLCCCLLCHCIYCSIFNYNLLLATLLIIGCNVNEEVNWAKEIDTTQNNLKNQHGITVEVKDKPKRIQALNPSHYQKEDCLAKVKMSSSTFRKHEKLGDESNFAACKVRLDIIADNNHVLEYIQRRMPEPPENASASLKIGRRQVSPKQSKLQLMVYNIILAMLGI